MYIIVWDENVYFFEYYRSFYSKFAKILSLYAKIDYTCEQFLDYEPTTQYIMDHGGFFKILDVGYDSGPQLINVRVFEWERGMLEVPHFGDEVQLRQRPKLRNLDWYLANQHLFFDPHSV
jgi:hypothetical protein